MSVAACSRPEVSPPAPRPEPKKDSSPPRKLKKSPVPLGPAKSPRYQYTMSKSKSFSSSVDKPAEKRNSIDAKKPKPGFLNGF